MQLHSSKLKSTFLINLFILNCRSQYLQERFTKYGHIESTKILKSKLEGFLTFQCDRHACLAYDWEKDKCVDKKVRVDSTWHQPDQAILIDSEWNIYEYEEDDDDDDDSRMELDDSIDGTMDSEASSPLLCLDDDSLFSLFDRCDNLSLVNLSKTCSRLEKLLKNGDYYFPNQKSFDIENSDKWLLIDVENVLQLIGRHLEKVYVWFNDDESLDTILSYVRFIVKYSHGGKMKDLSLAMFSWKNEIWYELSPVLKNLLKLEVGIIDYNEEEVTADLTELCPNLDTLILTEIFIVEKSLKGTAPNLKTFIWSYSWDEMVNQLDSFKFFYANPQLKVFECKEFNFENFALTLLLLPNIETLTLFETRSLVSADYLLNLRSFKNLRSLTLSFFYTVEVSKEIIIDRCGRLNNLLELKLFFSNMEDEKEPVVNLSTKFVHLERLELMGVRLDELAVSDFVRKASKIKVMHFHGCGVYATESLLAQLLDVMGQSSQRYRSECSLFIGNKLRNNFVAINNREVKSIGWVCKHRFHSFS